MHGSRWEMGSEFHLMTDFSDIESNHQAFHGTLFVNGRAALRSIVDSIDTTSNTCWMPSYVCAEVHNVLRPMLDLKVYGDYPDESAPRFDTLAAQPGDIVLIQDTFGLGDVAHWQQWQQQNPDVVLIEDISHSSTQERFLQSPADHVFSSIRKSLPVADGGLVFSRDGGLVQASQTSNTGSLLKLEAMVLKSMYLAGHPVDKQAFRDLQIAGEGELNRVDQGAALTHTSQMLQVLPHQALRSQWRANNERLRSHLQTNVSEDVIRVLRSRGEDKGLFHTVIHCRHEELRDELRGRLIVNNVFPAVHWLQNHNSSDSRAVGLSEVLLTLPTDYRYNEADIDRLAEIVCDVA